jgi:cation-transporting ATPase 13A1
MAATEEVDYYKLYRNRPLYFHFYIAPFVLIYPLWLYAWFVVYGVSEYFEIGAIIGVVILLLQILIWLFSMWSVHVRCFLTCSKVRNFFVLSFSV